MVMFSPASIAVALYQTCLLKTYFFVNITLVLHILCSLSQWLCHPHMTTSTEGNKKSSEKLVLIFLSHSTVTSVLLEEFMTRRMWM